MDLESWAGTKILSRGKSYQRTGEVDENDKRLSMIESGRKDSLEEGDDEYSKGIDQIEQTDDDGETRIDIPDVLSIVFKALKICSKPDVDKMEWAIDIELEDDYDLCYGLEDYISMANPRGYSGAAPFL